MSLWLAILALNFLHATASQYDDHCHPYACEFGECIPEGSSFRCKCQYDHVGPACNIWRSPLVNCDVDGPLSCLNGGVCNATENKFRCECPPNFTGLFCETDVDECSISPCYNGATCVNQIGSFHCICPPGYKGAICEDPVEICSSSDVPAVCAGCSFKAGNAQCDRECDRQECGYDGGDCMAQERDPFIACASAEYCARVFHDGVCDEICDTEWCLFDGFDCVPKAPKCPSGCEVKARNGFCDEECNREECDFDGGDCEVAARILSGELSIVVLAKPHYFVDNVQHFVHSLSKSLRSDIHIKRDELGLMAFVWKNGEVGERLHFGKQFASADLDTSAYSAEREGVIVWIEVDVSKCVKDCFSDIEIVASFIEADKKELLEAMNMSIYSAVAEKPKKRPYPFGITLLFIVVCISLMILIALLLVIQQKGSRKRKVVQNAPVWMPPTEFISKKGEEFTKEMSRSDITALESAKRRRLDPEEIKLLEQKMTPNFPRVRVEAKPKKLEPQPSKLHVEAASSDPISSLSNCEEVNRRGPYGRTPLMVLVRNSLKTEEQLIDEITRLHAAGADLDLCDDCKFNGFKIRLL
ncbi:hypothetical protein GCK32_005469 [Trichostrongylus colubriformis]|uniref:Uncharacterized protein n=1 Tax=Trichostrongylus colubriformis TaxID=6319 RepID=A0AAN8G1Z0_TRICO